MEQETKTRILDAAVVLFSEKGFQAVRTKEIAEKAGVNEVTLFRCFGNKKNIYHETFIKFLEKPTPAYLLNNVKYENPLEDLIAICSAITEIFSKNKRLIQMSFKEFEKFNEIREELKKQPEEMTEIVSAYLGDISVYLKEDCDKDQSAVYFITVIAGTTFHYLHHREIEDQYPLSDCMKRFVTEFTAGVLRQDCRSGTAS